MKLKYIIFDEAYPVLFGECQKHSDFKRVGIPTSAGFCQIAEEAASAKSVSVRRMKAYVHGKSESLQLASLPSDASIIERLFNHD